MGKVTLQEYFNSHKHIYSDLAKTCESVSELILNITLLGSKWTKWDWLFFLDFLGMYLMLYDKEIDVDETELSCRKMFDDIIASIDSDNQLDNVIKDKGILLNLVMFANGSLPRKPMSRKMLCRILAHAFKKFPDLWNMQWMRPKHFDRKSRKWIRSHRLSSLIEKGTEDDMNWFIEEYF